MNMSRAKRRRLHMPINETNEKRFESDIESALISPAGGYIKGEDTYDPKLGLYVDTLIDFIQRTQQYQQGQHRRKILQFLQQRLRYVRLAPCASPRLQAQRHFFSRLLLQA